jgi:hypothetical protein
MYPVSSTHRRRWVLASGQVLGAQMLPALTP